MSFGASKRPTLSSLMSESPCPAPSPSRAGRMAHAANISLHSSFCRHSCRIRWSAGSSDCEWRMLRLAHGSTPRARQHCTTCSATGSNTRLQADAVAHANSSTLSYTSSDEDVRPTGTSSI